MADLETFRAETRAWLEANCPAEVRGPRDGDEDYVWGGRNPNTSFDCSGFVSWALTQSGVCNTGRLGAQGLYNISTPVSSANARPGDLIFFVGTYDTPGVSHVGIYVGGGKMLHCGDPIQYADINTSYWQSHFYAFGRPPYN